MRLLGQELLTGEPEPPMRTIEGWPVAVRVREPIGMHELTATGANDEEGDGSRLPAPKIHVLARHSVCSLALEIEKHVYFFKEVTRKDGSKLHVPKRLPTVFVNHYLDFEKSSIPRVSALMTMPIVLTNGQFLAAKGLDRKRKIMFCIEPEIVKLMPEGRIPGAASRRPSRFLTDQ
jgi:hypothetical protein